MRRTAQRVTVLQALLVARRTLAVQVLAQAQQLDFGLLPLLRRLVNDYLQPPKVTRKMELGLQRIQAIAEDLERIKADNPHELMRALEVSVIRDCAEMAARASLFRTESRWGLYHHRVDYPRRDDAAWFCHAHLKKDEQGRMASFRKPVEPYLFAIDEGEQQAYQRLRLRNDAA